MLVYLVSVEHAQSDSSTILKLIHSVSLRLSSIRRCVHQLYLPRTRNNDVCCLVLCVCVCAREKMSVLTAKCTLAVQ